MTVNLAEALSDYLTLRRAMGFSLDPGSDNYCPATSPGL